MCRIPVNSPKAVTCRLLQKPETYVKIPNITAWQNIFVVLNIFTKFDTLYQHMTFFSTISFLTINIMNSELYLTEHENY